MSYYFLFDYVNLRLGLDSSEGFFLDNRGLVSSLFCKYLDLRIFKFREYCFLYFIVKLGKVRVSLL